MKTGVLILFTAISLLTIFSCNKCEDHISNSDGTTRQFIAPWTYVLDVRFSRETCATGPGVCFSNGDGDILVFGRENSIDAFFTHSNANNSDSEIGVMGLQIEGNEMKLAFSRSLEEDCLIIDEDVILSKKISLALGKESITIPKGNYSLSFDNLENGESIIPITYEEIQLDFHSDYGLVEKSEYEVGKGFTKEDFLESFHLSVQEVQEFTISDYNITGIANAEHMVEGETINVWHEYQNEPAFLFEAVMEDGSQIAAIRILGCGNPCFEERHEYLLDKYAWFFFGYN